MVITGILSIISIPLTVIREFIWKFSETHVVILKALNLKRDCGLIVSKPRELFKSYFYFHDHVLSLFILLLENNIISITSIL